MPGAAPGPHTPTGRTGRAGHREMHRELERMARRERVFELVAVRRLTFAQAAREVGVKNASTAWEDFRAVVTHREAKLAMRVEDWRHRELAALDALEREAMAIVLGDRTAGRRTVEPMREALLRLAAAGRVLDVQRRRAQLLGLDAQPEHGYTEEMLSATLRGLGTALMRAFTEAADRRRIAQVIRAQLPSYDGNGANGDNGHGQGEGTGTRGNHDTGGEVGAGQRAGAAAEGGPGEGAQGAGEGGGAEPAAD